MLNSAAHPHDFDQPPLTDEFLASIPLDSIHDPGSYVCNWNGFLLRVPTGRLGPRGQQVNLVGHEPLFVTKISDDPTLPLPRARELAADHKLKIGF